MRQIRQIKQHLLTTFFAVCAAVFAQTAAAAQHGLLQYRLTGIANSTYITPDNWQKYTNGTEGVVLAGALMAKTNNINGTTWKGVEYPFVNNSGYWYEGYIKLEAGKTYSAKSAFDDGGCVYIDGQMVYQQGTQSGYQGKKPSVTPVPFVCTNTTWYKLQVGVWDWGGGRNCFLSTIAVVQWSDADPTEAAKNYGDTTMWHEFWDADANGDPAGTYLATGPIEPFSASCEPDGFGTPEPVSVEKLDAGATVACSYAPYVSADGKTVAYATGWKLYDGQGVETACGSGNTYTYTHPAADAVSHLVWQLAVSNKVVGVESSCLTYEPAEQWVEYGANASVKAVPKEGCSFVAWKELPDGAIKSGTSAIFAVTKPATVVAACDFTKTSIVLAEPAGWTGKVVVPKLTITCGEQTLVQDTDFTVACDDVDIGPATATVTGINTWQGGQTFDFEIVQNEKGFKITIDRVAQRYPWNGLVDIDYTISGLAAGGYNRADFVISLVFSSASVGQQIAYPTDLPIEDGTRRITWDLKEFAAFASDATITAKIDLLGAPKASEAEFMLVDMSQTPYAVSYKRGFAGDGAASEAYTNEVYKRTTLVLRKVHAANQTFRMGVGVNGDVSNDDPAVGKWHSVKLTEDYFFGIFPLTYAQFKLALGGKDQKGETQTSYAGRCMQPIDLCPATKLEDSQVATSITTSDKKTIEGGILGALNAGLSSDVLTFTLPTEAQWEYAARNGTRSTFSTGSSTPDSNYKDYGWTKETSGGHGHLVATKKHDSWGFYDFIANVQEYCSDLYDSDGYESGVGYVSGGTTVDPTGPSAESGFTRYVARGGNWDGGWSYAYHGYRGLPTGGYKCDSGVRLKANVEAGGTTGASKTIWTTAATFSLDETASAYGVFSPAHVTNILPIAWNSATNWTLGGDPLATATLTLTAMTDTGTDDPSTWEAESTVTLASASGEGTVNWVPSEQRRYSFQQTVGENVRYAYFDLRQTEGIAVAKPISECTFTVIDAQMMWTGYVLEPRFIVTDGEKTLVKGTDYVVVYTAKNAGPATFTVSGLGAYMGSTEVAFTILAPAYTKVSEDATTADTKLDFRGDVRRKVNPFEDTPIAYNDMETFPTFTRLYAVTNGVFATNTVAYADWPKGGRVGDGTSARISAAPVANDGTVGDYAVIFEGEGEGPFVWHPKKQGTYALKLETVTGSTVSSSSLVRTFRVLPGLVLIFR